MIEAYYINLLIQLKNVLYFFEVSERTINRRLDKAIPFLFNNLKLTVKRITKIS